MSLLTIFIILIIITGVAVAGYFALTYEAPPTVNYVEMNDTVRVDYIGMFEDGRVFDTSILSVAIDNATYPKSISYSFRPGSYEPLEFIMGEGQVIQGFNEGVVGMREGQSKSITVPPEKGYGLSDQSLIRVRQLIEEYPVKEYLNTSQFGQKFHVTPPVEGQVIKDPLWGWDVSVFDVTGDMVTAIHQPELGLIESTFIKWDAKVIYIDSGANGGDGIIKVQHLLQESDENKIKSSDYLGEFILTDVNLEDGTFTVDYNREVVGKTLIFNVKVVEIIKPML